MHIPAYLTTHPPTNIYLPLCLLLQGSIYLPLYSGTGRAFYSLHEHGGARRERSPEKTRLSQPVDDAHRPERVDKRDTEHAARNGKSLTEMTTQQLYPASTKMGGSQTTNQGNTMNKRASKIASAWMRSQKVKVKPPNKATRRRAAKKAQ